MKVTKKWLSVLLALVLALALAGCDKIPGQSGGSSSSGSGSSSSSGSSSGSSGNSGSGSESSGVYAEDGYAEGRMGDVMHTYFFDYTVKSAYVCSKYEEYTPAEGNELLVVEMVVKNTGISSVTMWDVDFQAQWNDSQETGEFSWPVDDPAGQLSSEQLPAEYDLSVNEERTGLLIYEVPAGNKDFSISYLEIFDNGTEEGEEGDMFFVFFTADKKS